MKTPNLMLIKTAENVLISLEMEMLEMMYNVKSMANKMDKLDYNPHLGGIEKDLRKYLADHYPTKIP